MTNDAERVSDIVAGLRANATGYAAVGVMDTSALLNKAASIIEAQSKALAEARVALKPFAEFVPDFFDDGYQDDDIVSITSHHGGLDLTLTVGDFRRALAVINAEVDK
jgi:hypothetical protein